MVYYYSVSDTGTLGKRKSECSSQESNLRPSKFESDETFFPFVKLLYTCCLVLMCFLLTNRLNFYNNNTNNNCLFVLKRKEITINCYLNKIVGCRAPEITMTS